ncbi:MAG TPA: outer membrane protein assembly factor BamD [Candidatus Limnocylindrales bacterium]|nr:outer membrane protein assembly factor BamD [Candidatus Limnocylindrales bacterium]
MAGIPKVVRGFSTALFCALVAGAFCAPARGQTVQAQTGSSGQSQQPAQAQPETPPKDQPKKDDSKKAKPQETHEKKIKVHVVKEDTKKKKKAADDGVDTSQSAEPDKVLYERAMFDVRKGKFTEARLTLQALINTYPDSEYLAKAKLGVADSYYKEGGTSNLTQAIDEYKNFIIFFPFLDEAAYAQMQIGLGHFHMMEKPDRDTTQAIEAEQEFQTFLLKYPQSPLIPKAEQYLRDVQEVLADGEYKIARFYYVKRDFPASAARLIELSERYPLYSQSDEALWMLGDIYSLAKQRSPNEDEKNHWADLAGKCYTRIVQEYPASHLASQAKDRLKTLGMSIPPADPDAFARMQKQQKFEKEHHQMAVLRFPLGMLKSGPTFQSAAGSGTPNLQPPDDAISARDVLKQGAEGPDFTGQRKPADNEDQGPSDAGTPVEAAPGTPVSSPSGTGVGVQIITPPADNATPPGTNPATPAGDNVTAPGANTATPPSVTGGDAPMNPATPSSVPAANPPTATGTAPAQPPAENAAPAAVQGGTPDPAATPAAQTGQSTSQTPPQAANSKDQTPDKADKADSKTESTSKKKKGLKKLIPW